MRTAITKNNNEIPLYEVHVDSRSGDIIYFMTNGQCRIQINETGEVHIRGEQVDNNREVYKEMMNFLKDSLLTISEKRSSFLKLKCIDAYSLSPFIRNIAKASISEIFNYYQVPLIETKDIKTNDNLRENNDSSKRCFIKTIHNEILWVERSSEDLMEVL
jgi:hypothetical protein